MLQEGRVSLEVLEQRVGQERQVRTRLRIDTKSLTRCFVQVNAMRARLLTVPCEKKLKLARTFNFCADKICGTLRKLTIKSFF